MVTNQQVAEMGTALLDIKNRIEALEENIRDTLKSGASAEQEQTATTITIDDPGVAKVLKDALAEITMLADNLHYETKDMYSGAVVYPSVVTDIQTALLGVAPRRKVFLHQDGSILEIVSKPDDVDVVHFYKDALESGQCPFCGDQITSEDDEARKCPACKESWADLI